MPGRIRIIVAGETVEDKRYLTTGYWKNVIHEAQKLYEAFEVILSPDEQPDAGQVMDDNRRGVESIVYPDVSVVVRKAG